MLGPGIDVKVQTAEPSVTLGRIHVMQPRHRRKIAFELHPVQCAHTILAVGAHERKELTVRNAEEHPSIRAGIARVPRQNDAHTRIALGNNAVSKRRAGGIWRSRNREYGRSDAGQHRPLHRVLIGNC